MTAISRALVSYMLRIGERGKGIPTELIGAAHFTSLSLGRARPDTQGQGKL